MILCVALLALAVGCGDDPPEPSSGAQPAAGPLTPGSGTPGVPTGAAYDVTGSEWVKLDDGERLGAVTEFVDDRPDECGDAAPGKVIDYVDLSVGTEYPLTAPMAELLAEGCAAVLQS